jgi:tRNA A22 N-methylase
LTWVIADGLMPFREVDVAVIAGMGALSIAGILARGPRPGVVIAHCPDDPSLLRRWLASHGWRIDAEGLAREAGRFAEVIRAMPGIERSTGFELDFGPLLQADPLWDNHVEQLLGFWRDIAAKTEGKAAEKHADAVARVAWLLNRSSSGPQTTAQPPSSPE